MGELRDDSIQKETHPPSISVSTTLPELQSHASSIEVVTRHDLTFLYRFLRVILKRLRPHLVKPPKSPYPEGSPRLRPPRRRNIVTRETKIEDVWMYHFHALGPGSGKKNGRVLKAKVEEKTGIAGKTTGDSDFADGPQGTTVTDKDKGPKRKHRVYYFIGGGFQSPPSGEHWRFVTQLAQDLAGHRASVTFPATERSVDPENDARIELILVSYPLAPSSPASETLRVLRVWLKRILDDAVQNEETVGLMGDSSGATMIMSLGFWAVENYPPSTSTAHEHTPSSRPFPLTSLITISGPMDLTNSSPEIPRVDALDCILTASLTEKVAKTWCGHLSPPSYDSSSNKHASTPLSDPSVSPLFNPPAAFQALRDKNVHVHGVYGTHDVLTPSGLEFLAKCQQTGIKGKWLVWEGQMHCFPLAGGGEWLGIREGRDARWFLEQVMRDDVGRVEDMIQGWRSVKD